MYLVSPSQKQKKKKERKKESAYLHIVSTSLVLLPFLLDSPILYYLIYLFIYLLLFYFSHDFLSNTCSDIHKANNSGKLCYTSLQSYSEEVKHIAVSRLLIGEAG